uniref:Uncharacterized protein n=1 Tax=Hyaloperonospora arabidopsidis (strain Emoy2) TaxID=559515 RepID=M4BZL3_HYAAE
MAPRIRPTTIVQVTILIIEVKLLGSDSIASPDLIFSETMCVIPNLGRALMRRGPLPRIARITTVFRKDPQRSASFRG